MIDVYNNIINNKRLISFDDMDDFYYLQILQRKKENPQIGSNSRVIKNYHISSYEYFEKIYPEIKLLCDNFNARAMLRLNKRSYKKVAFKTLQNISNSMCNGDYSHVKKSYDRACGLGNNEPNKKWIIDIDEKIDDVSLQTMIEFINNSEPINNNEKVITTLPTKNGIHIITNPFDLRKFKEIYQNIDIHKDNPINLYIP